MDFVQVTDLTKSYTDGGREHPVLRGVSFSLKRGEMVALTGASGSGKSTLLHLLGGLDTPSSGSIRVNGVELTSQSDAQLTLYRRRKVGIIYQFFNLVPLLTVKENLLLPCLPDKKQPDEAALSELVQRLQMGEYLNAFPATLSGGQQQRVAIGRAVLMRPELMLADEPTGNLDSENSAATIALLREVCKAYDQTMLLVTHDNKIAAQCDRTLTMRDGRLVPGGEVMS